jgi:arylesterase/paraoxonase
MVSLRTFQWPILGVALFYSFVLSPLLWTTFGVRRVIQDLSEFNATCEKVDTLGLEGCEHMWMHHGTGLLYIACSESKSRMQWVPS